MFLKATNLYKSIGPKELFEDLDFSIAKNDKIALIGRNGLGKTTLLKIINGEDKDFSGEFEVRRNLRILMTRQEHFLENHVTPLSYILENVPDFINLREIINTEFDHNNAELLQEYSDAIIKFSDLGYYEIEDKIILSLESFGISLEQALGSMINLSGGEKRFVELVRIMYSGADLALIDEPTNHMDYVGKARFIEWMKDTEHTLFIVTHDRDVLKEVNKICELKDKRIINFSGNYDSYLKQNSLKTTTAITDYENGLKQLDKLYKQMLDARRRKLMARSDNGRAIAKTQEEKFLKLYEELKSSLEKPSFWIDSESLDEVSDIVIDKYNKYKDKNINIKTQDLNENQRELINIKKLSLGYEERLFTNLSFDLRHGDKVFIKGRNGAGKSTLLKKIIEHINHPNDIESKIQQFDGNITISPKLRLGVYEQEISKEILNLTLSEAIKRVFHDLNLPVNDQKVKSILGNYLFDPFADFNLQISNLSGGQKARFQLIKMLANKPNLLILDEPTNHLDLPSIEELEKTLLDFQGAIIYVTHDNYLVEKLGGKVIEIGDQS